MNEQVYIRCATLGDAQHIAEIQVATWKSAYAGLVEESYLAAMSVSERTKMWSEVLSAMQERSHVFVATGADSLPIGFISSGKARGEDAAGAEIYAFYLLPEFHGKGFGQTLLYRSLARLQADGFYNAKVEVLQDCSAHRFYKRSGAGLVEIKSTAIGEKHYPLAVLEWSQLQEALIALNPNHRHGAILNSNQVRSPDIAYYSGSEEVFGRGANFGRLFDFKRLGIHQELIEPGRRTSWPHAESTEDEFVYVISGNPSVWIDGEVHSLEPGDAVGFPAGTGIAHTFLNSTSKSVELLVVGDRDRTDNQVVYPLHPKRNAEVEDKGVLWKSTPVRKLQGHDGKP
jgi:uncharacterized cupin superfamily protein/GNAT superfamily N-acetyltransferase